MFIYDAMRIMIIPTIVFQRIVSLSTITAIIGARAGFKKNANEPVVASESLIDVKYE